MFAKSALLGGLARNPFQLGLILDYDKRNPGKIPARQSELYESYTEYVFRMVAAQLNERISPEVIRAFCRAIASEMFDADYGLEIPIVAISTDNSIDQKNISCLLTKLAEQRFLRISKQNHVSFTHRRFHEFFLLGRIERFGNSLMPAIIKDSKWRDAFILYAELAPQKRKEDIITYCNSHISANSDAAACFSFDPTLYLHKINALRFLVEAFRGNEKLVLSTAPNLGRELIASIKPIPDQPIDLLAAIYAVEAVPYIDDNAAASLFGIVLDSRSPWLTEHVMRACRYLNSIPPIVQDTVFNYLTNLRFSESLARFRDITIGLQYNASLRDIETSFRLHALTGVFLFASFWGLLFSFPIFLALALAVGVLFRAFALVQAIYDSNKAARSSAQRHDDLVEIYYDGLSLLLNGPGVLLYFFVLVIFAAFGLTTNALDISNVPVFPLSSLIGYFFPFMFSPSLALPLLLLLSSAVITSIHLFFEKDRQRVTSEYYYQKTSSAIQITFKRLRMGFLIILSFTVFASLLFLADLHEDSLTSLVGAIIARTFLTIFALAIIFAIIRAGVLLIGEMIVSAWRGFIRFVNFVRAYWMLISVGVATCSIIITSAAKSSPPTNPAMHQITEAGKEMVSAGGQVVLTAFSYVVLGLIGVFLLFGAVQLVRFPVAFVMSYLRDMSLLKKSTRMFKASRDVIGLEFTRFSTAKYRLKYVLWLEEEEGKLSSDDKHALRNPSNKWLNGTRPNIDNDDASVRLALLDARWFGIERR